MQLMNFDYAIFENVLMVNLDYDVISCTVHVYDYKILIIHISLILSKDMSTKSDTIYTYFYLESNHTCCEFLNRVKIKGLVLNN